MQTRKCIIALDVDGTLMGFGGIISQETIKHLLYFAHVGIVSSRPDAHEIARRLGLGFAEVGKASALVKFANTYPDHLGKTYIADTEQDKEEAEKAGWDFVNVNDIKLNLGCGNDLREGYINCDVREIKGVNLCFDLEEHALPFQDGIISEIVLRDALEHINWRKTEWLLNECYRVLKPNGKIYIQTPDLEAIAKKVILNPDFKYGELSGFKAISYWVYGALDYKENLHKSGFTIPTLKQLLESLGFTVDCIMNDGGTNIICQAHKS